MGATLAQSLAKVVLHIVFSTKNRGHWIEDSIRSGLHAYLAGACRVVGSEAIRVGGTDNYVHIACTLPRTLNLYYNPTLAEYKLQGKSMEIGLNRFLREIAV
jgi:REP element-mobilizing transposase RayT